MDLNDFNYELPAERIALHPLVKRDQSRLLTYNSGRITHHNFSEISGLLPDNSLLFFNDTKVIPARIKVNKASGALIEIFLLNPISPSTIVSEAMTTTDACTWHCIIGNKKKWRGETLNLLVSIASVTLTLNIELIDISQNAVRFTWENSNYTFAEIVESIGQVPLPPYLNRQPIKADKERYQTVYSKLEGAVAAPTAGLHLTENIIGDLELKGHEIGYLTLHVGAGTFQPIKSSDVIDHNMHVEQIVITKKNIEALLKHKNLVIPVGTTSMRSLESLYWYGVQLLKNRQAIFQISKELPYESGFNNIPPLIEALEAVSHKMSVDGVEHIIGDTGIFIYPGYKFQVCHGLITNFHQPKSSLILLIATLIGKDWRRVYQEALNNDYRFLSYGDSSLLLPDISATIN